MIKKQPKIKKNEKGVKIKITKGFYSLIDEEDFLRVSKFKWSASVYKNNFYAITDIYQKNKKKKIRTGMHRFLMNFPKNKDVDHINGNGLDNRKINLRVCSRSQNSMNRDKSSLNKSGYKGVSWCKAMNSWQACISFNRKTIYLGCYSTPKKAHEIYSIAAKKYYGEFAYIKKIGRPKKVC